MSEQGNGVGRLLALAALCLLAVAALGLWAFRGFVQEPVPEASPVQLAPAEPVESALPQLVVTALEGTVERGGAGGWQALRLGEVVPAEQSLRTAPNAHAELAVGSSGARLVVPEASIQKRALVAWATAPLSLSMRTRRCPSGS